MDLMTTLPPGEARRLETGELEAVLAAASHLHEADSHMTGPLRVLGLPGCATRWILEFDTRRRPVLRHLQPGQDPFEFIQMRREAYERMWDG